MTARILDVTEDEYFADPCETPSLSKSIAHVLLNESPAKAYHLHPRLGGGKRKGTPSQDLGILVHALLLGSDRVVALAVPDWKKKEARARRNAAIAQGLHPVTESAYEAAREAADGIRKQLAALGYELTGKSELAVEWREGEVLCRGRMDHVFLDRGLILDLKTTSSAKPIDCARDAFRYGYDIQWAAYTSAIAQLRPDLPHVEMELLFCEMDPPYIVTPARLGTAFQELGRRRWAEARALWQRCLSTGQWPGYATACVEIEPPAWAKRDEVDDASDLVGRINACSDSSMLEPLRLEAKAMRPTMTREAQLAVSAAIKAALARVGHVAVPFDAPR